MALSKKTKKARQMADKIKNESPRSRKMRLENMKKAMSNFYSHLSSESKKELSKNVVRERASLNSNLGAAKQRDRLAKHQLFVSQKRDKESPSVRLARLSQMRSRASQRADNESPISREIRLAAMREQVNLLRNNELPISREERLTEMRQHANITRHDESPSSREDRLTQLRLHANMVRRDESPSSREDRLTQATLHAKMVRRDESPSSREERLSQIREIVNSMRRDESPASRKERLSGLQRDYGFRRQLLRDDSNFLAQISQVAEIVCYSCDKLLYQQQARRVTVTANITVLPLDRPDVIVCCNRCATSILKNKTPPMAYWNCMRVVPIPPELECLNEMELRMISRVRPFIKLVRLGGRFGQQGFRGQAILFAQQVEELAEQLPITAANAGLTIVAETLENVSNSRRYFVDATKIKTALEWLVKNNYLYANVEVDFTINSDAINDAILQAVATQQSQHCSQQNEPCYFKDIGNGKSILRGHFNQGSDRFGEESRGRQCTANAAVAIGFSALKPLPEWSPSDVDSVLLAGDIYFSRCMACLAHRPNYLNTEELLPNLNICDHQIDMQIDPDVVVGLIRPTAPDQIFDGYHTSMESAVDHFFRTHDSGIITCQTQYAVAIFKHSSDYYIFDSHSRGAKGFVAGAKGTSMLMKFPTEESLCHHLLIVLEVRQERDQQFAITAVSPQIANSLTTSHRQPLAAAADLEIFPPVANVTSESNGNNENGAEDVLLNLYDGEMVTTTLMPIDTDLPDINAVLPDISDQPIPIYQLRRKTAPPISVLREQRAEELAWVRLFPDGKNGLREHRQVPITPLDYYQSRVMSHEKRFQTNEYLFYALSTVELFKAQQNVSVCGRLRQNGAEPCNVVQNVHLVMRNIRGTQSYWHRAFTDLMAMVRNLGAPHFYITLSCNDLNWPDVLRALLVADGHPEFSVSELSFSQKLRLVESYPVTLCRQFMFRFNAFLTHLKRQDDPLLGCPVVDFWWRIEFQLRGSPHVHMVVWCADMPAFDSEEGVALLDRVVTCHLPSAEDKPEMRELVSRLQTHKHTQTCYKNNTNFCRFSFPRAASERTRILDDDEARRNGGRFYVLKRTEQELNINNYNTRILQMWKANIDIQPCGTATGIAYYISKYISKSEPAEVSRSIQEAIRKVREKGGSMAQQVFAMQNAILSKREVSACEAAVRLCHLKMRDSSRKVVFVNTCCPELRYRMLRVDDGVSEPYHNIFDRYVARPHALEELSLGEFAVWYEPVTRTDYLEDDQDNDAYEQEPGTEARQRHITLLDNHGRMKKRNRPAVLRTRYYTPNSDPEAYFYSLLVSHIPFRAESQLMEGYNSSKEAFLAKRTSMRPLQEGHSAEQMTLWEQEIQQAIARVVAENIANDNLNGPGEVGDNEVGTIRHNIAIEDYDDGIFADDAGEVQIMTDQQYAVAVNSMNLQQRELFQRISVRLLRTADFDHDPLRVFVTGGAGTGKTFTLKLIVEQIRRLEHTSVSSTVVVTAPTGVAARLIGGSTLHSTFALPIEKGKSETMRLLTGERLQRERQKWNAISWLIIDEVSMVPYTTLRNVHLRLQQIKMSEDLFGGVNIILFGDLMQLPPVSKTVGGAYCFKQPPHLSAEVDLWAQFNFCELPQNMRQAGDTTFVDILNALRVGQLTMRQLEILDRRRVPLTGLFADGECVRIFPTTKMVEEYNRKITDQLAKCLRIYEIIAVDLSVEAKSYGQKPREEFIPVDPNKTGGIPKFIKLGKGSRVMLRKNLNVNHGLVNGAMGVIRRIEWPALRRDQLEGGELPQSVFVEFDDTTIRGNIAGVGVKIEPTVVEFDALRGQGKVERRMLPLILCWAVTVHKLQGTTLDRAVVDLSSNIFSKGQAYVALSRVRQLEGLAISSLDPRKLLNNPHDKNSLEELERLRNI